MTNEPKDYHAIALWGMDLASFRYYIEAQQEKAARDGAPLDAIYKRDSIGQDGSWQTVSGLKEDHPFREAYGKYLADVKAGRREVYYQG